MVAVPELRPAGTLRQSTTKAAAICYWLAKAPTWKRQGDNRDVVPAVRVATIAPSKGFGKTVLGARLRRR
jgi:hypothetical protein